MPLIACHAGSASDPNHRDGPEKACQIGLNLLSKQGGALQAVISATASLEDDERFNAGTGSNLRFDGITIQMDAACMSSLGDFGAVAAIERVKNPVQVAQQILETPQVLLAGSGATAFARKCGFPDYDPTTVAAQERFTKILQARNQIGDWSLDTLSKVWNYDTPLRRVLGTDTVGAVAWDGEVFAAALSSGGLTSVLQGRVGDVPLPGCGLYAGLAGAVAITGDGEYFARSLMAYRTYLRLEQGNSSRENLVEWALKEFPENVDIGLIVIDRNGFSGGARHNMAWSGIAD